MNNLYAYCDINRFEKPNNYMYPQFKGCDFLTAYVSNRKTAITELQQMLATASIASIEASGNETHQILLEVQHGLKNGNVSSALTVLEDYIRRFEVAKRLRNKYPVKDKLDLASVHTHMIFYNTLIDAYVPVQDIRYLNVMLKVGDSLVSALGLFRSSDDIQMLSSLIMQEVGFVNALIEKMDVCK
jgi:hypothetical protein